MKQFIKKQIKHSSNLHSLAGNMLHAAFSLITFLLMVRMLSKDLYGQWVIYITAASLLDMLRLGLTGTGAIRLISTGNQKEKKYSVAASYQLGIISTIIIALIFVPLYFLLNQTTTNNYYLSVLLYYPILAIANLPFNQANTYSQGLVNFKRVMLLRGLNGLLSFLLIGGYILFFEATLQGIILVHVIANVISSIQAMTFNWDGIQYIKYFSKKKILNILNFGKYSTASYVGSNLLRSSDTIILSLSATMGAQIVAIYAIPLKFVEFVEIPLRSITATAFPKLSRAWMLGKDKFNDTLGQLLAFTTLLLFPGVLIMVFLREPLLYFIGGSQYIDSMQLQETIVFIIAFYVLLLPLDRISGVALFALDKPKANFIKIMIMLVSNIIFDLIAVFVFQSLIMVAIATVFFTIIGIGVGWYFIYKSSGFPLQKIPYLFMENIIRTFTLAKKIINGKSATT